MSTVKTFGDFSNYSPLATTDIQGRNDMYELWVFGEKKNNYQLS